MHIQNWRVGVMKMEQPTQGFHCSSWPLHTSQICGQVKRACHHNHMVWVLTVLLFCSFHIPSKLIQVIHVKVSNTLVLSFLLFLMVIGSACLPQTIPYYSSSSPSFSSWSPCPRHFKRHFFSPHSSSSLIFPFTYLPKNQKQIYDNYPSSWWFPFTLTLSQILLQLFTHYLNQDNCMKPCPFLHLWLRWRVQAPPFHPHYRLHYSDCP